MLCSLGLFKVPDAISLSGHVTYQNGWFQYSVVSQPTQPRELKVFVTVLSCSFFSFKTGFPLSLCLTAAASVYLKVVPDQNGLFQSNLNLESCSIFSKCVTVEVRAPELFSMDGLVEKSGNDVQVVFFIGFVGNSSYSMELDLIQDLSVGKKIIAHVQFCDVLVDLATRRPHPLPQQFKSLHQNDYSFPKNAIPHKSEQAYCTHATITKAYLDTNGHANFTTYIAHIFKDLQSAFNSNYFRHSELNLDKIKKFQIFFHAEGRLGDVLAIETWEDSCSSSNGDHKFFSIIRNGNGKILTQAVIEFTNPMQLHSQL